MFTFSFHNLRVANALRLPHFKNSKGKPAHSMKNGSDWAPAQWLQAVMGELGEYAAERIAYEQGDLTPEQYSQRAHSEIADVQIYLDIMAMRALDQTPPMLHDNKMSSAQRIMHIIAALGGYCNARKKFERGDYTADEFDEKANKFLRDMNRHFEDLCDLQEGKHDERFNNVTTAHVCGVRLDSATIATFNNVSDRVGCNVKVSEHGVHVGQEGMWK